MWTLFYGDGLTMVWHMQVLFLKIQSLRKEKLLKNNFGLDNNILLPIRIFKVSFNQWNNKHILQKYKVKSKIKTKNIFKSMTIF